MRGPDTFTESLFTLRRLFELFKRVLQQAAPKGLLAGEHFSVDGTLIQARAGHKSFVRKVGADYDSASGNFRDQSRSNDTHVSNTGADARSSCKGDNASRRRVMGHTPSDNRHGLVASAMAAAGGFAGREAAKTMIDDARPDFKSNVPRIRVGYFSSLLKDSDPLRAEAPVESYAAVTRPDAPSGTSNYSF